MPRMNSSLLLTTARSLGLAFLCAGSAIAATSAGPSAQIFDPVQKPERIDAQWRAHLCALLPAPCEEVSLGLFRPRDAGPDDYVLLSAKPLAMSRVKRGTGGAWQLERRNDMTDYKHSIANETSDPDEARFSLAPALYPLAEGRWAVAVIRSVNQGFSGGGAMYERADFVALDDTPPAEAKPAHAGVPYFCMQDFRACFTEKEYKTSPHCREQNDGQLRIAYGAPAKAGEPYAWTYTWRESAWPGNEPKSKMTHTVTRFTDDDIAAAPFCGEGR
jgi:hypothetical protein